MEKRRLLVVNFFPAFFPPSSGGEQRYYYLYRHLSERYDVTLLSPTYADRDEECVVHTPSFREHRVPKPGVTDSLHVKLGSLGIGGECSALVVALAAGLDDTFANVLDRLAQGVDAIVHEFPYTLPYDRGIGTDGIPRIYNSHNVEYRLAEQILKADIGRVAVGFIRYLEQELIRYSSAVFATSEAERDTFISEFGVPRSLAFIAPNGYEPSSVVSEDPDHFCRDSASVVFLGSAHPPNIEALDFIATKLAPELPHVRFAIVGSVGKAYDKPVPDNVALLGRVSEAEKARLLLECGTAINPLFTGAGTNLKMLDYMAHGAPIVTTEVGARGLPLRDGLHVRISRPEAFAETVDHLLGNKSLRRGLSTASAALARSRYSWATIANGVADAIDRVLETQTGHWLPRRKLLYVCDYSVERTVGGGQVRIRELLREIGCDHDVTFLCLTNDAEESRTVLAPGVVQRAIPKTSAQLDAERSTSHGQLVSIADILASLYCNQNEALLRAFREEVAQASAVTFAQCYLAPLLDEVPENLPVVYSSQNCEMELKASLLDARNDKASWIDVVHAAEDRMLARANLVVCVSHQDADAFRTVRHDIRTTVIENGVRVFEAGKAEVRQYASTTFGDAPMPLALFLGSAHPPNIQAARFIIDIVAPANPDIQFLLAGTVCNAFDPAALPLNLTLLGFLGDAEKLAVLHGVTMAVNPMLDGGGSSLKVGDYFAAGLPMVSTSIGTRGYEVVADEHYVLATSENFATKVHALAHDTLLQQEIGRSASDFARNILDWRILGGKYRKMLRTLLPHDKTLRVLALTYRFDDPPPGGAEAFLANVLRELSATGDVVVDLAACDAGSITNHWHFSAHYEPGAPHVSKPAYLRNQLLFPIDEQPDSTFSKCSRLFRLWAAESRISGTRLAPLIPQPMLLGGWNNVEHTIDGKIFRWTTTRAQVLTPFDADVLEIEGTAPTPCRIEFRGNNCTISIAEISGHFSVKVPVNGARGVLEIACSVMHHAPGDPRELGCLVSALRVGPSNETAELDLREDHEAFFRRTDPQTWIDELIATTKARSPADDALFVEVRGPHSTALREWLADNAARYDVVLAQGVPFATSVLGVDVARHHGVPVVVLPHFHMEDKYYHWRSFYTAFQQADAVIGAPNATRQMFFDRIGAKCELLAGGGLDLAEFAINNIQDGRAAFRKLHVSQQPFVLVLGRKAGAKHYQIVIDAITKLRSASQEVDVVLIGPDEDHLPINETYAYYYGAQPRKVVIGALAEALCLVNMSDSESFGIVLLEAWLAGTPVVAQRRCLAFSELVKENQNGFLAGDAEDAADAIGKYLVQPSLASAHAKQGSKLARGFDWSRIAQGLKDVLLAVCTPSLHRQFQDESAKRATL